MTWEGRHEDAIRLAGASESLRKQTGGGPPPGFAGLLEGDPVAEARVHLSEEAARRAWDEGMAMGLDEAMATALEGSGPPEAATRFRSRRDPEG